MAHTRRIEIQGVRDRLVNVNGQLRGVLMRALRIDRQARVYLRQKQEVMDLTAKAAEDLLAVVLEDVSSVVEHVKLLMDMGKEALTNIDERTRLLDSWFTLHKQYAFLTLSKNPGQNDKDPQDEAYRRRPSR